MTTEQKAKAYDEALEAARKELKQDLHESGVWAIQRIFPILRESEDERIRKKLYNTVLGTPNDNEWFQDISKEAMLAWLEKQKEPHYTKRNELFDRCVENCDPKTVEEVNKRVDDIMNMPELSAFEQALTNFIGYWEDDEERWPSKFVKKHGKHILDMAREELQKEQKPAQTSEEKEYIRTLKSLISDFIRDKQPADVAFYQKIYDWLDGRHVEQKPNIELIQRSWYMEGYHDREFGKEPKWIIKTGEGGPKHDQQCDFDDGYFTGIDAVSKFLDTLSEEPASKGYDEAYLNEKIAKASKTWEGVDVDKYIDEVRGREPDKSLDEEIREYMSNEDNNPFDWDWRDKRDCARHFAEWGAEHAKK